ADCLAILIFDPGAEPGEKGSRGEGAVAAVHAGWRGTRLRILEKTLRHLFASGSMRAETTWVAFSACLGPQSLQVGPDVAEQLDPDFLIRSSGRIYFDMPASNRAQALACGVLPRHIRGGNAADYGYPRGNGVVGDNIDDADTLRNPSLYFS